MPSYAIIIFMFSSRMGHARRIAEMGTGSWTAGAAAIAVRNILHLQP
jgi:hypothetical protein